jgi:HEAT repeat protein
MAVSLKKIDKWSSKKKAGKLIKALSVNELEIRLAAIKALGNIKEESIMYELLTFLKNPDPAMRLASLESLGKIANGRSFEYIRQMWETEADKKVREEAQRAMNVIREKSKDENESKVSV